MGGGGIGDSFFLASGVKLAKRWNHGSKIPQKQFTVGWVIDELQMYHLAAEAYLIRQAHLILQSFG